MWTLTGSAAATILFFFSLGFLSNRTDAAEGAGGSGSPYTLPWQLRSVLPANAARIDAASAFFRDQAGNSGGFAVAGVATGSYRLLPELALLARAGMVSNSPPAGAPSAAAALNPLVGALYSVPLPRDLRLGFFFGLTVPVGSGGGDSPNAATRSALTSGILARSAMDNALFSTNYLTAIPGVDLAYVSRGFTAQIEATLLHLMRTRGKAVDRDASRINFTSGFALGYAFLPEVSAMGEIRYQRWLRNETVAASAKPARSNLSFAVGPRFTLMAGSLTLKPGIAYAQGLSGPIASGDYSSPVNRDRIVFLDVPIVF